MLLAVASIALAAGCAPTPDHDLDGAGSGDLHGNLHVLVAASLLAVAETLAHDFEMLHPGVAVRIVGAGSSALREQVLAGAPADVFVPADPIHLDAVAAEVGLMHAPVVVARNTMVLAVPASNEAAVASLADLARPALLIGLCAPEVPCGELARAGLERAGIEAMPDTEEPNARALVTKLAAGELDAAVVYASDATPHAASGARADAIVSLGWPTDIAAPQASYAAAVLSQAPNPAAAEAFVSFLRSHTARDGFFQFGFAPP